MASAGVLNVSEVTHPQQHRVTEPWSSETQFAGILSTEQGYEISQWSLQPPGT